MKRRLSLLEYAKVIIKKVSFDRKLVEKEYLKAMPNLNTMEKKQLQEWVQYEFGIEVSKNELNNNLKN